MPEFPVAIVGVKFLNSRPLLAGMEAGIPARFRYTFKTAEPASCAELVATGQAQVGLIPVAALAGLPEVKAHPLLGVAAKEEIASVLLLSKVPLAQIRVLAAHTASRTSVTLARLLLMAKYGVTPHVVASAPPAEVMLEKADAAVIIGDPALAYNDLPGVKRWDLAAEWVNWRGLPFVFAVWGIRLGHHPGVGGLLEASLAYAREHWGELLPTWARQHGMAENKVQEYLEKRLTYQLGEDERVAVEEFLHLSQRFGLLPPREEVWGHV